MKKTRVALVYNAYTDGVVESVADSGGVRYLRQMIRGMARALRRGGPSWARSDRVQTRTVPSWLAEISRRPSGEKAKALTSSV